MGSQTHDKACVRFEPTGQRLLAAIMRKVDSTAWMLGRIGQRFPKSQDIPENITGLSPWGQVGAIWSRLARLAPPLRGLRP
jgi:hypothetical protein